MPLITWKPPIDKWYNVDAKLYTIIFEEAKERLADILSESESITEKSVKIFTAIVAVFAFVIGVLNHTDKGIGYYAVFSVIYVIEAVLLIILMGPKNIKSRGIAPRQSIPYKLDDPADKDYQTQLWYYHNIVLLQDNIDFMEKRNSARIQLYRVAVIGFIILLIVTGQFIIFLL